MLQRVPGFVGPSYRSQSVVADSEQCMNFVPELLESVGAKSRMALYPTPGFSTFSTANEAPIRGMFAQDGRAFFVCAHKLYEVAADGTLTDRGTLTYDDNPVTICSSGDAGGELFITSGDKGYTFNLGTDTLAEQLSSGAFQGGYLDGFFLALNRTDSILQVSALLDGTSWDPSDIAERLAGSDKWQALIVAGGSIWLFGSHSTEVWYNAGLSPVPFALIPGAVIQYGIAAPFSAARLGNVPMWLGQSADGSAVVFQANGLNAQRISNHAVEHALRGYVNSGGISDAVGWTYQEEGHLFYVLSFPAANATWAYDVATQMWHERGYWNTTNASWEASRVQFHMYAHDKHLVGDRTIGRLYEQSINYYTDVNGSGIRRVRRCPHLYNAGNRIFYSRFRVDLETGVGLSAIPETVTKHGTAFDDVDTVGVAQWQDYGFIGSHDDGLPAWVQASSMLGLRTHYLKASNFGFSIPPYATIVSISVSSIGTTMVLGTATEAFVRLIKGGIINSTNRATSNTWTTDVVTRQWGNVGDLWGTTWTPADINDSGFGVVLSLDMVDTDAIAQVDCLEITVTYTVTGHPTERPTGVNPSVVLRMSRDGGRTFRSLPPARIGRSGEYLTIVDWNRLGMARDAVFELVMTDPVPWRLIDAYAEFEVES